MEKIARVYHEAKARNPYIKGDRKAIEALVIPHRDNAVANFLQSLTSSIATPAKKYIEGETPTSQDVVEGAFAKDKIDWTDVVKSRYPNLNETAQKVYGEALNMILDPSNLLPGVGIAGEIKNLKHVSPYSFSKFDLEKALTGEGHAAFGHGAYFTESPKVVESYIKSFSRSKYPDMDMLSQYYKPGNIVEGYSGKDKVISFKKYIDPRDGREDWSVFVRKIEPDGSLGPIRQHHTIPRYEELKEVLGESYKPVKVYDVTIKSGQQHELISWEKPVPKSIRQKIIKYYSEFTGLDTLPIDSFSTNFGSTGREVYDNLVNSLGSQEEASKFLKKAGIDGIEYQVGTLSGVKDSPHKNYVIFSDKDIKINKIEAR